MNTAFGETSSRNSHHVKAVAAGLLEKVLASRLPDQFARFRVFVFPVRERERERLVGGSYAGVRVFSSFANHNARQTDIF
jgi:hypothetical protein